MVCKALHVSLSIRLTGDGADARGRLTRGEDALHGIQMPAAGGESILRACGEACPAVPSKRLHLVVVEGPLCHGNCDHR